DIAAFTVQFLDSEGNGVAFAADTFAGELDGLTDVTEELQITGVTPGICPGCVSVSVQLSDAGGLESNVLHAPIVGKATGSGCIGGDTTLCIDDEPGDRRFQVEVSFHTSQGGASSGGGRAIPLSSLGVTHGGMLWFFSPDNPELLVKVLDACSVNGHDWIFASAGTNVGVTLAVTDTKTGATRTYTNPDRHPLDPVQDTSAFACTAADALTSAQATAAGAPAITQEAVYQGLVVLANGDRVKSEPETEAFLASGACIASATTLCIDDSAGDKRYQVQVAFATTQGGGSSGSGHSIPLSSLGVAHGGLFWFFSADNPELLIKVLNTCSFDTHHWVFASAGTNVGVTITVKDTKTGFQHVYTNPDIHTMEPIQDTVTLPCP
ncbi:MAG: hypothetical protein ACREMY_14065, partial [bacterium]